ncbi:hypothetical protein CP8484711_0604, partial [Chlamydia psittaci 84-8471/1]
MVDSLWESIRVLLSFLQVILYEYLTVLVQC